MKKLASIFLALVLMLAFAISVNAQEPITVPSKASYDANKAIAWTDYTYTEKEVEDMVKKDINKLNKDSQPPWFGR